MARVTVEDCLESVTNRFELVMLASRRARQLAAGGKSLVDAGSDKPTVVALREIAEGRINQEVLAQEDEAATELQEAMETAEAGPYEAGPYEAGPHEAGLHD